MKSYKITFHRLSHMDSNVEIVQKLSEGNPGAMSVVCNILKKSETNIDLIMYLLVFDSLEVYGAKLYMLWNDCCDRDFDKLFAVIDALVDGKYSEEHIHAHINYNGGRGIPFEEVGGNNIG